MKLRARHELADVEAGEVAWQHSVLDMVQIVGNHDPTRVRARTEATLSRLP